MHRKFIILILSAAIAVAGLTAAPARAGDDAAKWIAGIAAVAIIGAAISENEKKKKRRRNQASQYYYDQYETPNYRRDPYARPLPRRVQRKILPNACRVRAETRNGHVRGFGQRCLQNNYNYVNSLPRDCAVRAKNRRGKYKRVIYRQGCLKRYGYQVAREDRR